VPLIEDFFSSIEGFPCPELFAEKLEGFDNLCEIWDILKRIQAGFVGRVLKPRIQGIIEEGAIIKGEDIFIGRNSRVAAGAMIMEPTIIGNNVEVRHGAFIRGNVILGDGAVVGHATEVVRSVFLPGAKAPHFNYVGDSILGTGVNLGAGTKLSNLKNDGTQVKVLRDGKKEKSGLRKFGAIIGDNCLLGCNSVTNPGTVFCKNCRVYPNATVAGFYKAGSICKLRQSLEVGVVE